MLLYIHVPFCKKKCEYCAFHSGPFEYADLELYVPRLIDEISLLGEQLGHPKAHTLYFGGGTPSLLPPWALFDIMAELDQSFTLADQFEFTFEGNPDSLDDEFLHELKMLGVNRLSIGIQSLVDANLQTLGRPHTVTQAVRAVYAAKRQGFVNLNLDMMFGLPGQRLRLWLDELKEICELRPTHFSCYNLTVEPDTPLEQRCHSRELILPEEEEQAKMFLYGAEFLESRGYLQYEISNFSKMGFQSRHNMGYWEGEDYVGFGPSAVSTFGGKRRTNPRDLQEWAESVRRGQAGASVEELDLATRIEEMVMLRLRTSRGLRLKAYRELTGKDFVKQHQQMVNLLHQKELLRIQKGYLRLTKHGMLVSDAILSHFLKE